MSFTKIDCAFLKNEKSGGEYSFCTLFNPQKRPGSLSFAASLAARDSIGGQVASKLALEHFVEGILDFFASSNHSSSSRTISRDAEIVSAENLQAIESAFKRANSSVYNFGHKLAAGGRMAASLLGAVLQEDSISIGKVGFPSAYLCRGSELYPFYEAVGDIDNGEGENSSSFVGVASLVSVQLSSVHLEGGDVLFFAAETLSEAHLSRFFRFIDEKEKGAVFNAHDILQRIFPRGIDMEFVGVVRIGPDTIFLDEECI